MNNSFVIYSVNIYGMSVLRPEIEELVNHADNTDLAAIWEDMLQGVEVNEVSYSSYSQVLDRVYNNIS